MANLRFDGANINADALDAQLRASLPGYDGLSLSDVDGLLVHVREGEDAEALRGQIEAVVQAHDPTVQTAQQQADAARAEAVEALKTADVAAIRTGLEAKGATVAQLQAQVASLAAVVEQMRVALGLGEPPDGRG